MEARAEASRVSSTTDSVFELTVRINDERWESVQSHWLVAPQKVRTKWNQCPDYVNNTF